MARRITRVMMSSVPMDMQMASGMAFRRRLSWGWSWLPLTQKPRSGSIAPVQPLASAMIRMTAAGTTTRAASTPIIQRGHRKSGLNSGMVQFMRMQDHAQVMTVPNPMITYACTRQSQWFRERISNRPSHAQSSTSGLKAVRKPICTKRRLTPSTVGMQVGNLRLLGRASQGTRLNTIRGMDSTSTMSENQANMDRCECDQMVKESGHSGRQVSSSLE
mmetsp:Transcript_4477/g.11062  ORF Transcript_4477/g.11062 Transcript_4477/m.11062 type:complete len:218 (+) Transcript_4477:883-1536(+)